MELLCNAANSSYHLADGGDFIPSVLVWHSCYSLGVCQDPENNPVSRLNLIIKYGEDPARLLNKNSSCFPRLEGLTGEAQGDVCDDMPPAPPGLTVPPVDVKCAQNISPELALSSIVRVVRIARPATKGSRTLSDDIEPGPVNPWHAVEVVRELRSERNELRRRDRLGREEISQLRSVLFLGI